MKRCQATLTIYTSVDVYEIQCDSPEHFQGAHTYNLIVLEADE